MQTNSASDTLIADVSEYMSRYPVINDADLLMQWRLLQVAQMYLALPDGETRSTCADALRTYVLWHNRGRKERAVVEAAIKGALVTVREYKGWGIGRILPEIPAKKRLEVSSAVELFNGRGTEIIDKAIESLPSISRRLNASYGRLLFAGMRKRFALLHAHLLNDNMQESDRMIAAAAIQYLDETDDVVPDTYGLIGLLDDDFALRYVLRDRLDFSDSEITHWAERICSLWDDLPFLQGLHLVRNGKPIAATWLDRMIAFTAYEHVMASSQPLIVTVPERAFEPLETIVVLLGLLLFEHLTAESPSHRLKPNRLYCIDGKFYARFVDYQKNLIRFRFANNLIYGVSAALEHRVAECSVSHKESQLKVFQKYFKSISEPIQRFFDWGTEIGSGRLVSKLALVMTHRVAHGILSEVSSNGISMLGDKLVQMLGAGSFSSKDIIAPVLVVPSLSGIRELLQHGITLHTIVVDGYARLVGAENDYWYIAKQKIAPRIIVFASNADVPQSLPEWLVDARIEIPSRNDLAEVVELEEGNTTMPRDAVRVLTRLSEPVNASLVTVSRSTIEDDVVRRCQMLLENIREAHRLPTSWFYLFASYAADLRRLVTSTATSWNVVREVASAEKAVLAGKVAVMSDSFFCAFGSLIEQIHEIERVVADQPDGPTSLGRAVLEYVDRYPRLQGYVACRRSGQVVATQRFLDEVSIPVWIAGLVKDVPTCGNILVPGWQSRSFVQNLWESAPGSLTLICTDAEQSWWHAALDQRNRVSARSMVATRRPPTLLMASDNQQHDTGTHLDDDDLFAGFRNIASVHGDILTSVIAIRCTASSNLALVVARGHVIVDEGGTPTERQVGAIQVGDTVLLMRGTNSLSPAEEFVELLVQHVREQWPEHVERAREWRRALERFYRHSMISIEHLRRELSTMGVERESQTLEGWLSVDRAAPISPRRRHVDLELLWPTLGQYSEYNLSDVIAACEWLRRLRGIAERALLNRVFTSNKEDEIDTRMLEPVLNRLQQCTVRTDVVSIERLKVPAELAGCWVPEEIVRSYTVQ